MSASRVGRACLYRRQYSVRDFILNKSTYPPKPSSPTPLLRSTVQRRAFSRGHTFRSEQRGPQEEPFNARLGKAWRNTKVVWKPIPIGLGIAFLGVFQFLRIRSREAVKEGESDAERPVPRRQRIRPEGGGWQVSIMSTLPLKALSRVWGRFNEIDIPYYLRVPGFKLYGWVFGVNFDEIKEPDLHVFPNLASFFYRELKPGLRPLDPNMKALLSPADGKVLQFGEIQGGEVEQVKGMTYGLDALLGKSASRESSPTRAASSETLRLPKPGADPLASSDSEQTSIKTDEEFANVNGISYTLPNIFSGSSSSAGKKQDASTGHQAASAAAVQKDLATTDAQWWSPFSNPDTETRLYYIVVYLAPGDYHRFHSPVSWVCSTRRHFAGELYSVSPYVQRTLPGLFTLNERVVLLGRWKYGFFSYIPVGATNVGSIKINFDRELRTNSLLTDTQADREAAAAAERGEPYSGYSEASYDESSQLLGGHPLRRGEEMGGFQLGSSIVMVFEAPAGKRTKSLDDGGLAGGEVKGGWKWNVERGQKVKVGEAMGWVLEEDGSKE